ncbi:MAG: hypothetical protein IJ088_12315 [Clostridia bacterium]|nr:hypothetical protein [Clostridia bacterium]
MLTMMKITIFILTAILALFCLGYALAESSTPLPAFTYSGDDPIVAAVYADTAANGRNFLFEENMVSIPFPVIHKVEQKDDSHALVYGNFWVFNFKLTGDVLEDVSGGERPAILTLEKKGDTWSVTDVNEAEGGESFAEDIVGFCNGDKDLEKAYFESSDFTSATFMEVFLKNLREYVTANNLPVKAWKEYGTDPVPLFE